MYAHAYLYVQYSKIAILQKKKNEVMNGIFIKYLSKWFCFTRIFKRV